MAPKDVTNLIERMERFEQHASVGPDYVVAIAQLEDGAFLLGQLLSQTMRLGVFGQRRDAFSVRLPNRQRSSDKRA